MSTWSLINFGTVVPGPNRKAKPPLSTPRKTEPLSKIGKDLHNLKASIQNIKNKLLKNSVIVKNLASPPVEMS